MGGESSRPRSRHVAARGHTLQTQVGNLHRWQYEGVSPVSSAGTVTDVLCSLCQFQRGPAPAAVEQHEHKNILQRTGDPPMYSTMGAIAARLQPGQPPLPGLVQGVG